MSYKNLLVAVEPNQEARTIAARAREIAPDAEISVLAVLPDVVQAYGTVWSGDASGAMLDFVQGTRQEAERQLRDLLRNVGIARERVQVRFGSPARVAHEVAQEMEADCIVAGCHGQHGIELAFGSTANALIHGLDCDAYLVRVGTGQESQPRPAAPRVVIAVDGTDDAHEVAEAGKALLGNGSQTTLITVIKPIAHTYGGLDLTVVGTEGGTFEEEALREGTAWLDTIATRHELAADKRAVIGSPGHEIRTYAKDVNADLIVVGSHGRHGLGRLLGSTANGVLHGVGCDVLVVRVAIGAHSEDHSH